MADPSAKNEGNVEGKWYVDDTCTGCGLCVDTAEDYFQLNDDDMAIVVKQPEDDDGEELCVEAMEGCPTESIGDDG
jgi:ferredoxin